MMIPFMFEAACFARLIPELVLEQASVRVSEQEPGPESVSGEREVVDGRDSLGP